MYKCPKCKAEINHINVHGGWSSKFAINDRGELLAENSVAEYDYGEPDGFECPECEAELDGKWAE